MKIAINTDFLSGTGNPEFALSAAADAGFSHLHWCHQWCTDFIYGKAEISAIATMLKRFNLKLLDIHGSAGDEKCWFSTTEYCRQAGVELVLNRLRMLAELGGCGAVMMHVPFYSPRQTLEDRIKVQLQFEALRRSLDELIPEMESLDVVIALENLWADDFVILNELLKIYPAERIGICYDSGHGNCIELPAYEMINNCRDRIRALHLHDNDGKSDLHQPPFMNILDWEKLAAILYDSSYTNPLSFELSMRNTPLYIPDQKEQAPEAVAAFLKDAYDRCERFSRMVAENRA